MTARLCNRFAVLKLRDRLVERQRPLAHSGKCANEPEFHHHLVTRIERLNQRLQGGHPLHRHAELPRQLHDYGIGRRSCHSSYSISGGARISIWLSFCAAFTTFTLTRRDRLTRCRKFQLASTGTFDRTAVAT